MTQLRIACRLLPDVIIFCCSQVHVLY